MIAIIDYHMGNLRSVEKAFKRIDVEAVITSDPAMISSADKLVLPGVGHFKQGMLELEQRGLIEVLNREVLEHKKPILGICLGMQLLTKHSEEGDVDGLGWVDAETVLFQFDNKEWRVPHIGWNTNEYPMEHPIFQGLDESNDFYFVHSYYVRSEAEEQVFATAHYGHDVVSAIGRDNVFGVQFHPEKSHHQGLKILQNFAAIHV